ncbi:hypothetical protein Tco_0865868 [Tanacetum coccineum]
MNHPKKDKITRASLEGPMFKLLNGTYKNNIELEYHMEQCYLALSDKLDWTNPEGDRCPFDISKPIPLQVTKTKAARYDLKYIKDMIPKLWSTVKEAYDKNDALGIHHLGPKRQLFYISRNAATSPHEVFSWLWILSVITLTIDNQFGYGYLKEIVIRIEDLKEYAFREADFSRLHMNDIEDLFLLYVQHKIHNLTGNEIVHLVNALPKEPHTIFYEPRGVVYLNKTKQKRLIKADELYKFSDGTLKLVRGILHDMLNNFVLEDHKKLGVLCWWKYERDEL